MMIPEEGMLEIAEAIEAMASHCIYKNDGVETQREIYKIQATETSVKVLVYFDDTIQGNLTDFQLISFKGNVLASKVDYIDKTSYRGWLIAFVYRLVEVEV